MNNQIFLMQNNTLKKLKHGEIVKTVFKYIIDNVATQPTKHRQTNTTPTILFETEYFPFEKKKQFLSDSIIRTFPSQAYTLPPCQVCRDANKYEYILN